MQGRNDGYEFLVYNGAACYIQYVLFYKRNIASKDDPTAPLTSVDLTRAMQPFLLKSDKALYGDWSFPKQIPRSISYRYEVHPLMHIQGPVRMFVQESVGWPVDNGNEHTPRFLYVLDSVGFIERAFLLPVKIDKDGYISGYNKMFHVLTRRADDVEKSAAVKLSEELKLEVNKQSMKEIRDWFNKINKAQPDPETTDVEGQSNPEVIVDSYESSAHYQNDDGAIVNQERYKPDNEKKNKKWERIRTRIESGI